MIHWRDRHGNRWYTSAMARCARLFRHHVNRPGNPRGRILRMPCAFDLGHGLGQFHHVDYDRPFRGVWACESCHRKVEHGSLAVTKTRICDYTELVRPLLRPTIGAAMRALQKSTPGGAPF